MIVGLTGGIATGKSTVTQMLREMGAYVVDADVWARKVVAPGSAGLRQIQEVFGTGVLTPSGELSRTRLAELIFADEAARQKLNTITHPLVREGMRQETMAFLQSHPNEPIVWDVPLLFEGETQHLVDTTILVYVDERTQLQRLCLRNGYTEAEAFARISAQMPIEEKKKRATYIIDNTGTLEQTREQVQAVWIALRGQNVSRESS